MALASEQRQRRSFIFENSNNKFYRVSLDVGAGTGTAYLHGDFVYGVEPVGLTTTALTFTPAAVAGKSDSYLSHAAIFNTSQALSAVLNAV